ncbi:hypothetical protein [Fluviicola taffensis]|uniref:Uncharacterized protein n=1 Tax=Fluviicola taffensis (strain DSM 16823 / NCIMB 13979 / RW262) TaxID=755732 RepID=F2IGK7_FLUTR|nr:hypothetical protein [Fluviicola taffensis]AEA42613.1 hypothetical protein Fluta_0609 [Fluviicola taffensis DSM 16823]
MKLFILLIAFSFCFASSVYSKDKTVLVEWKFNGIASGFDHLNRLKVFIDGIDQPISEEVLQSNLGKYELKISKGIHKIQLINEAFYNGKWQDHTFKNEFSMDAICEFELNADEVGKVRVVFDLDGKPTLLTQFDKKGQLIQPKLIGFKGKHVPLIIDWKFINIESGYDHLSRICIYVDDVKFATSIESLESVGGVFEVMIPKGEHYIRIVSECKGKSGWQEHTIVNDYSTDALLDQKIKVLKAQKLKWIIDLNNEQTVIDWEK